MKIAILGYGTIGSGVFEVFGTNVDNIKKRAGEEITVKRVLDLREFPGDPVEACLTHDFRDIADDPEIECVVETMGGNEPAYTFLKELLLKGKSVCTSNKELVANHGTELLEIARQKKINFLFEASVGGAIPIIRPLMESFSGDEIIDICGIINGTTNYILTKMDRDGADYADVLAEAQAKGFAERNPEADVEGHDAARKIAILASLACGAEVDFRDVYTEGITKLTALDFEYARRMGRVIKLIASMRKIDGKVFSTVRPMLIPAETPLYTVNDVFNGILVNGRFSKSIMFYGSGAGKLPTASAVAADVIEVAKNRGRNIPIVWSNKKQPNEDRMEQKNDFFIRVKHSDRHKAKEVFSGVHIDELKPENGEYAFIARNMAEKDYEEAAKKVDIINKIRLLNVAQR